VADELIPVHLIALQRAFDAARAAVVAASARSGPVAEWPEGAFAELEELRRAERDVALALGDAREAAGLGAYADAKRVQEAARSDS
jgi:hypothetical protein